MQGRISRAEGPPERQLGKFLHGNPSVDSVDSRVAPAKFKVQMLHMMRHSHQRTHITPVCVCVCVGAIS